MSTLLLLLFTALGLGGLYFLLGSGLSLIYGLMSILNLAHGFLFAAGAYALYLCMDRLDVSNLTVRLLIGVLLSAVLGVVLGALLERGLLARLHGDHLGQLLLTIGISFAGIAVLGALFGYDGRNVRLPGWLDTTADVLGAKVPVSRLLVFVGAALLLLALMTFLRRSRHGLIIRAGVDNRTMVEALGIDVRRSFTLVFAIGGALATIGGALGAVYFSSITPHLGTTQLIFAFIVIIIGGLGSIVGTALSAVVVSVVQVFGNYYVGSGYGDIAVVILLAIVLIIRPQGLLGRTQS